MLGQSVTIDEADRWMGVYGVAAPAGGGILNDFAERQATKQLILFPSVIVSRDAYEQVGGFCTIVARTQHRLGHVVSTRATCSGGICIASACTMPLSRRVRHKPAKGIRREPPRMLFRRYGQPCKNERTEAYCGGAALAFTVGQLRGVNRVAIGQPESASQGRYNQARWAWMLEPRIGRLIIVSKVLAKVQAKRKSTIPGNLIIGTVQSNLGRVSEFIPAWA